MSMLLLRHENGDISSWLLDVDMSGGRKREWAADNRLQDDEIIKKVE